MPAPRTDPLTPEQQALAATHVSLARMMARPFQRAMPSHADDFESAAMFGLTQAARVFKDRGSVPFSAYAHCRIRWKLRNTRRKIFDRLDVAGDVAYLESTGRPIFDTTPDPPIGHAMMADEDFMSLINVVPPSRRKILVLIYCEGMLQREVAERLGMYRCYINKVHKEALAIIREARGSMVLPVRPRQPFVPRSTKRQPLRKLTQEAAKAIFLRRRAGESIAAIAHDHGVTKMTVSNIANGKIHQHATAELFGG